MEDQIQRTVDSEVVTTRKRRRPREKEAINQATGPEAIDQRPSDETKALEQSAPSRQVDQSHQTTNTEAIFPSKRHSPLAATSNLPDQPEASSSKLPPLATEPGEPALQTRKRFRRHHREMASEKGTTEQRPVKKSKKIKGKEREKEQGKHPKKKTKETTKEKRKERAQEVEEEIPSWDCLPIAQNEVLRILPVWSKDGRWVISSLADNVLIRDWQILLHRR
jgi:hypothetical protein